MPTLWDRQYLLIVRDSIKEQANALYGQHVDKDGAGDQTFVVPLSVSGNPPAQAWACCTRLKRWMRRAFEDRFRDAVAADLARAYRLDDGSWTVESALAHLGLKIIDVED